MSQLTIGAILGNVSKIDRKHNYSGHKGLKLKIFNILSVYAWS